MLTTALLVSFLTVTAKGFLRWIFKPWGAEGVWAALLDAGCRLFGILHRWSGLLFVLLALYHIYQHWDWIVAMTEKMRKEYGKVPGSEQEVDM